MGVGRHDWRGGHAYARVGLAEDEVQEAGEEIDVATPKRSTLAT